MYGTGADNWKTVEAGISATNAASATPIQTQGDMQNLLAINPILTTVSLIKIEGVDSTEAAK